MSLKLKSSKILQHITTIFVGFALISSGFFMPPVNALSNKDLSNEEISEIQSLMNEGNLKIRKIKVKDISSKTNNPKISSIVWSYYGETNDRKFDYITYPGYQEYISSRQGLFKYCVNNNFACITEARPFVELHQRREGYSDYYYNG